MTMLPSLSALAYAMPTEPGGCGDTRQPGLKAPMMDATYKMLATLGDMSKAARTPAPLDGIDPAFAADTAARDSAGGVAPPRQRRSTAPAPSDRREAFRAAFRAEIAQRKTENLARIEITGYDKDDAERMMPVVENLKLHMVAEGLDARLFELKTKRLALWDDQSKHWSVSINYVSAENAATPTVTTLSADAVTTHAPVVLERNGRHQRYAILEEVAPRSSRSSTSSTPASPALPVCLSTVERRSLDIIAFDVKKLFGTDSSEITLIGYAKDNAELVRPKLEAMANYLVNTKGLKRDSIKLDPQRLDHKHDNTGSWDRRVEIDVRDISLTPRKSKTAGRHQAQPRGGAGTATAS
ncbi:hypothetical protein [Bordetella sp. LUAb4]|uniref:hypothetical protein n=1 Tax=Bordetella sp. LUAb4 TaxID=2843195 RepID=UPI001E47BFBF|nr:hypothetical protein [Bordetella sp. LUAb4]